MIVGSIVQETDEQTEQTWKEKEKDRDTGQREAEIGNSQQAQTPLFLPSVLPPLFWSPHTDFIYLSFSAHALTSNPSGSLQASCLD